jgi:ABC-type transport system substrate-binding protein
MKMSSKVFKHVVEGVTLALLVYVVSSGAVPLLVPVHAQGAPLFQVTLIAPTGGNQVRRQYASIITSNMISLGIDARLFYVTFPALLSRIDFESAPVGSLFNQGGYDMGFVGYGATIPIPDFSSNIGGKGMFPPGGNNYALYDSPEMNALLAKLYSTVDVQTQIDLSYQMEALLFHDKPYNYIYATVDPVPRDQKWTDYGSANVYNEVTYPDIQHWAGGDSLTFAEANPVFPGGTLNPLNTPSSNSWYSVYIYYSIMGGTLGEFNSATSVWYPATATSITSSPDLLDWTVNIRPGVTFQDGVEVTADDFVWTEWATTFPASGAVGQGTNIMYVGNKIDFTFLNGTTTTVDNSAGAAVTQGSFKAISKYSFTFHMYQPYAFTKQVYGVITPLPKHIMEKFDPATWDSAPFSTANGPNTYTWDPAVYGGSGSYTAVGPVGAGPYIMTNYDFTANTATMKKWPGYWNATGLEALGQFTIDTYKVVWINSKDAAIAAMKNGEVNVLDYNYNLQRDVDTLKSIGANIISSTELGWQEQGFNLRHSVFGTGVDTPLGKSNPSQAAEAARHVRTAISHLIPRDQIVKDLLAGSAYPLATLVGPGYGVFMDPNLKPDTYDINAAAEELRAAGYTVSIAPPAPIAYTGSPMLGTGSVTITGHARVANEMLMLQQSTDGGQTWTNFAAAVSRNDTTYSVAAPAPPAFGAVWYRANFTGYTLNDTWAMKPITPDLVDQYISTGQYFGGRPLLPGQVTDPISVSSTNNDYLVVGVIIVVILAIVGFVVWNSRRKKPKQ